MAAGPIRPPAGQPGWGQQEQQGPDRAAGVSLPRPVEALQEECQVHNPGQAQQAPEGAAVLPAALCIQEGAPQGSQGGLWS